MPTVNTCSCGNRTIRSGGLCSECETAEQIVEASDKNAEQHATKGAAVALGCPLCYFLNPSANLGAAHMHTVRVDQAGVVWVEVPYSALTSAYNAHKGVSAWWPTMRKQEVEAMRAREATLQSEKKGSYALYIKEKEATSSLTKRVRLLESEVQKLHATPVHPAVSALIGALQNRIVGRVDTYEMLKALPKELPTVTTCERCKFVHKDASCTKKLTCRHPDRGLWLEVKSSDFCSMGAPNEQEMQRLSVEE